MNKTPFLPGCFLTRMMLPFVLGVLVCATGVQPALADAAPPSDPTVGNAGPYRPQKTMVQMLAETVQIDVPPYVNELSNQMISVSASFTMQNRGQAEEKMQVIFPLTRLKYWENDETAYMIDRSTFVVWVDGQQVPTTEITTPAEKGYQLERDSNGDPISGFVADVAWAAFDVTFPVHQNVSLRVEYKMGAGPFEDFTGMYYIMETGAGWYGRILSADLVLHLPYTATEELVQYANPGYVISGNDLWWKLNNIEPTRKDNLSVKIIRPGVWQTILDLRSRVELNPDDADTWCELGDAYRQLAIYGYSDRSYYINSPHFADLSIESYEKAVALRPDWGKAHYKLAYILWLSNPKVAAKSGPGKSTGSLSMEDPSIQRVLQELKLAWAYGAIYNEGSSGSFVSDLNTTIPGLDLTPPATLTFTPEPVTKIPTSTPTAFVAPTGTPLSSAAPTPAPANASSATAVGGMAIGLLIVAGVLIYSWRSRFGDRN